MSEELKIEKGIAIPKLGSSELTRTLRAMEVGDSFFIKKPTVGGTLNHFKMKNPGFSFSTRTEGAGKRVWRTA